nr:atrochrysone carboxylic acid synthase [Quercus suber]
MPNDTVTPSSESDWEAGKMDLVYCSNEFPREDLTLVFRRLRKLTKDSTHVFLAQFLKEATHAIKQEIRQLPGELRSLFGPIDSILDWAELNDLREGPLCGAVDGVLLVVVQVATYISLRDFANTAVTALGIGLLSSTAVALGFSPSELPFAGTDAVRLAFRLGIHVRTVSECLEARAQKPETWAYVVHNIDEATTQRELDSVQARDQLPVTDQIFISAVSRTSVTISGPPSKLRELFNAKSRFFRNSRFIALPVYGGICHAPHLYSNVDVNKIVHGSASHLFTLDSNTRPVFPIYSTSTGAPYPAKTATEAWESVVTELLTKAIRWDDVIGGVTGAVQVTATPEVALHCFGNSIPLTDLTSSLGSTLPGLKITTLNFVSHALDSHVTTDTRRSTAKSNLAIVGMSCRLPGGATSTEKFWELLEQGLDVSRRIPPDRFDVDTHYDPTGKDLNKSMTQYGCFIDEPGMFDAPFFNMSPREAQVVDPQMRLALVTAYEALERAGYVGNRTASTKLQRIGTYYGQAADDYREVNQGQEVSTYYIPGGCRAFGPGRINYFFKFAGPSYSIDTACSSGLAAIEDSVTDISSPRAITHVGFPRRALVVHFTDKSAGKTWDATADGYCRADAIGSVVIKRLEDAEMDNDNILGVVLAAGTNHSAEAVSITHPHAGHQAYLSRQVLRQACVDPLDVSYIELHGTGTQAGDFEEMTGILDVYAPLVKRRSDEQPLHIGSVKANVGHSESAAGTTALIKVLLMMQKNRIPPHIGIKTEINPKFPKDSHKRNLHIPLRSMPWIQHTRKRIAAVNNFGAAGGNTMMIIEDAPARSEPIPDPRSTQVVAVSAKTKGSLVANIENLTAYLDQHGDDTHLPSLGYSTTARKYQYTYRVAFAVADVPTLRKHLASSLVKVDSLKPVGKAGQVPPVAFAFTGQGASHKSMSLDLYRDRSPVFRECLNNLDSLAQTLGFPSFLPALDGSHTQSHAHSPVVTQLALVCSEIALARHWSSLGVEPDLVVGHSLGEYAALHIAGVISASDSIYMVGRRAQMLEQKCQMGSHTMVAVRGSLAQITATGKDFTISCINSPLDIVISGTQKQMSDITAALEGMGIRCIELPVAFAFHSEQTDLILDEFERACKTVTFREPNMPVISPLLGKVVFDGKTFNANYMRRATREMVDFVAAIEHAQKILTISDDTIWVEVGPHPVCVGFVKSMMTASNNLLVAVPSFRRNEDNWKTMAQSMAVLHEAGLNIDWNEFHRPYESHVRLLDLPTYAFNDKNYWLPYVGDWCLTKGNSFYTSKTRAESSTCTPSRASEISTSAVQQIVDLKVDGSAGTVVMESDLMHPDFLAAANGHRMNGCGVVTSSIHADIAFTLGKYLYGKFFPKFKGPVKLNVADLVVTKGLIAQNDTKTPQLIQVTATSSDIHSGRMELKWRNVKHTDRSAEEEPFATAKLHVGDANDWLSQWEPVAHLVQSRVEVLERLALEGKASRFSHNMAYTLFASNLVDYAEKYRGMQSVILHEFEGCAEIQLTTKGSGSWTIPPYFIDSVAHLAGFIMNCSDAMDAQNNYCVTPGWKSMRFAEALLPGAKYRSYVKMTPTVEDPSIYFGDVYIMRHDASAAIIGMVGGIQFRRYPRILLNKFFSPPDQADRAENKKSKPTRSTNAADTQTKTSQAAVAQTLTKPSEVQLVSSAKVVAENKVATDHVGQAAKSKPTAKVDLISAESAVVENGITAKAMMLIAKEAALEVEDLQDDVGFSDLGIDSLMSLVLSEKLRSELDVKVSSSLFLDYPLIGDLRKWLDEYYD